MTSQHSGLTGLQLHEPFHYVDASDPGAVGADKYWLDISGDPYVLNRRDPTDTFWTEVGGGGGGVIERSFAFQRQSDLTIPDSVNTAVDFTATFLVDNGGFFSIGDPTRFTIPSDGFSAGRYLVGASVRWTGDPTGIRQIFISKNGSGFFALVQQTPPSSDDMVQSCQAIVEMAATDYFELYCEQESGAGLDIISSNFYSPLIWGFLIH